MSKLDAVKKFLLESINSLAWLSFNKLRHVLLFLSTDAFSVKSF